MVNAWPHNKEQFCEQLSHEKDIHHMGAYSIKDTLCYMSKHENTFLSI